MFKLRKVGWSYLGRKGLREGGGNCLKYLKRGWNEKEGREDRGETKVSTRGGGQAGSRGGFLKMGAGIPLRTMGY